MFISLEKITKEINNTTFDLVTIVTINLLHLYYMTRQRKTCACNTTCITFSVKKSRRFLKPTFY